jgi:hypothetical protein
MSITVAFDLTVMSGCFSMKICQKVSRLEPEEMHSWKIPIIARWAKTEERRRQGTHHAKQLRFLEKN